MKIKIKRIVKIIVLNLIFFNLFLYSQSLRDPFKFDQENKKNTQIYPEVLAISKFNNNYGAILKNNLLQETVFEQDIVWGYKVLKVSNNSVILFKDNNKIKLNF
ncbi:MAG: hypothetical protein SZ59_C0002G0266 [candidate division TM6 bacterium GW2011_GWF2_28_16]|nr:MAG: hypothetical protein SZ59_C0002G0266 [candidate division TM6 bacterium GW2011_GWF2_28_16]